MAFQMQGEVVASAEAPIAVAAFERLCSSVFPVKRPILVQIVQMCLCDFYQKQSQIQIPVQVQVQIQIPVQVEVQIKIQIPVVARQLIRPGESPFAAVPTASVRLLA